MRIGLANLQHGLLLLMAVSSCQAHAQQWNLTSAPATPWISIACSADGARIVAVAYNGPMYVSTNGGVDWNPVAISGTPWVTNWASVGSSADGTKLVATTSEYWSGLIYPQAGLIYFSTDSGISWAPANAPAAVWGPVAVSADGSRCFAGIGGYPGGPIYASTNSGAGWFLTGAPTSGEQWSAIALSADGTVVIASSGPYVNGQGSVYTSTNAGSTWRTSNVPALPWNSVAASADGRRLIAVPQATYFMGFILARYPVQMSSDFGSTWSEVPSSANPWNGVASSAEGLRWTAVTGDPTTGGPSPGGGFYLWTNGYGQSWYSTNTSGESLRTVACSADGARAFAASSHIYAFSTTPVPPRLSLSVTDGHAIVSWIVPSTPYVLEESANLNGQWTEIVGTPALNGIRKEVSLPSSGNGSFYRLRGAVIFSTAR
jgi:hypothetical protein